MIYPSHSTNKYKISFSIFNGSSSEQFHCSSILQSCHVHLPNATACVRTQQLRASFNSLGGEVFKTEWIDLAIKCFQLEVSNSQPTSYEKRAEAPSAPALKMLHCGRQSLPGLHCYCEDWRRGLDAVRGFCQVGNKSRNNTLSKAVVQANSPIMHLKPLLEEGLPDSLSVVTALQFTGQSSKQPSANWKPPFSACTFCFLLARWRPELGHKRSQEGPLIILAVKSTKNRVPGCTH